MPGLEITFNGTVREFVATMERYTHEAYSESDIPLYEIQDVRETSARVEIIADKRPPWIMPDWQWASAGLYATPAPGGKTLLTLYSNWQEWRYVELTYRPFIQRLVADGWVEPSALDYQRAVARLGWIEPAEEYSQAEEPATSGNRLESLTPRDKGAPRGTQGGTLDRVREARELIEREHLPKTTACKRVGIDPRTYDKHCDLVINWNSDE